MDGWKLGNHIQCTDWPWNALPTDDESPQTKHVNSYMMLLELEDPTQPIFGMGEAKHSEFAKSQHMQITNTKSLKKQFTTQHYLCRQ